MAQGLADATEGADAYQCTSQHAQQMPMPDDLPEHVPGIDDDGEPSDHM